MPFEGEIRIIRWPVVSGHLIRRDCGMSKTYRDWSPDQTYHVSALASGLAPRGRSGLLPPRYRRHPRPHPHLRPLRARTAGPAAVPPPDDGHTAAVLLRHRHPFLAEDHAPLPAPTSPAASSSARTSPTSAPSATSARSTWLGLEALFVEVLKLCALAGLTQVGTIALDGTKVKANASRHKAMSYDRMKEEEKRLKEEIARLLAEAEATDAAEDAAHGRDRQRRRTARRVGTAAEPAGEDPGGQGPAGGAGAGRGGRGGSPPPGRRESSRRPRHRPRRSPSPRTRSTSPTPSRGS